MGNNHSVNRNHADTAAVTAADTSASGSRDRPDATDRAAQSGGPGPAGWRELGPINGAITAIGARVTRRRTLGVFATLGRAKRLFRGWLLYSAMMMPFGYLGRQESEAIILRVAFRRDSAYEADQHRDLAAKSGVDPETIEAMFRNDHGQTGRLGILLDAADELIATKKLRDSTWERLRGILSARDQVAFVILVTNYDGLATALDVLGVPVDERRDESE